MTCVQIGSIEGFTSVCDYSIYCHKPNFRFDPNPENSRSEWGAGADTTRYGLDTVKQNATHACSDACPVRRQTYGYLSSCRTSLDTVKQDGGIIYAEDGRAIVAFRSNDPKRIRFRYFLKSFEEPNEDLRECICHYKSGELIYFLMKLPHKGKYTLEMYAKVVDRGRKKKRGNQRQKKGKSKEKDKKKEKNQKNSKETKGGDDEDDGDETYESICNYLIKSDVGCSDLAPYPPLNNVYGQTGDVTELNDADDVCLQPDTHTEAVIDPYESGRMTVVMQASRAPDPELRAEMTRYYHRDGEEEDCTEYALMRREDLTYTLDLIFPKVGFYKLSLLSGDQLVHQYLVNVIEPDTTGGPYPTTARGWRSDYELRGTKTGNLEADRKYLIQASDVSSLRILEII